MINTCYQCGLYRVDKTIDPSGPAAICPECGHRHPFLQQPLFLIGGASSTGKTTICQHLLGRSLPVVALDVDILWRPEFNTPETKYRDFFETWLRMAKNIGQSGRPVALFGAGIAVPENIENCVERRYFSQVHYLALTCEESTLRARLQARPAWREAGSDGFIQGQVDFNRWFLTYEGQPAVDQLDTTHASVEAITQQLLFWVGEHSRLT